MTNENETQNETQTQNDADQRWLEAQKFARSLTDPLDMPAIKAFVAQEESRLEQIDKELKAMEEKSRKVGRFRIAELTDEIRAVLDYDENLPLEDILTHHARALDSTFRRLLYDGDKCYSEYNNESKPAVYNTAIRAQNQFCTTLKTIKSLKEKEKKKKHVFKNAERTEGSGFDN